MRHASFALVVALAGCSSGDPTSVDAGSLVDASDASLDASDDAATDAATDAANGLDAAADAGCQPTVLLAGGSDVATQGWSVTMQGPATVSYGADYVRLETSTSSGASTGGQLLLSLPGAVGVDVPFAIEIVMQVETVDTHNALDSGAAILASFTAPFGTGTQRAQMVYLDSAAIGWSDNSQSHAVAVTDGAYHTYVVSVDASQVATVTIDGATALTRNAFVTNGTIAIGDQTNDPNVDGAMRIRSVRKLCL